MGTVIALCIAITTISIGWISLLIFMTILPFSVQFLETTNTACIGWSWIQKLETFCISIAFVIKFLNFFNTLDIIHFCLLN
jgi:hypothetical protein